MTKARAGTAGSIFEDEVMIHLENLYDFETVDYGSTEHKWLKLQKPDRYILRNVPYENLLNRYAAKYELGIQNSVPRTEFVIHANDARKTREFPKGPIDIRIECKWQAVDGTTQQKLLWSLVDLQYAPEKYAIILMDGGGFHPVMKQILTDIAKSGGLRWKGAPRKSRKIIQVMDFDQLLDWTARALPR